MRQKGGVDSPFRSPTRAFFVRLPRFLLVSTLTPFESWLRIAGTSAACSTMRATNGRCARSAQCTPRFPSLLVSSSPPFFTPLRLTDIPTPPLFFSRSLWKFNFYPPSSLSLSLSRLCNIFNVHELAGSRYH